MFVVFIYLVFVVIVSVVFHGLRHFRVYLREGNAHLPVFFSSPSASHEDGEARPSEVTLPRPSVLSSNTLTTLHTTATSTNHTKTTTNMSASFSQVPVALSPPTPKRTAGPAAALPSGSCFSTLATDSLVSWKHPPVESLVVLAVHVMVVVVMWVVYRSEKFFSGCCACYPFLVMDVVAFLMLLGWLRCKASPKGKAVQAMGLVAVWLGLASTLLWPLTLLILDPDSPPRGDTHFWGLLVWSLVALAVYPPVMDIIQSQNPFALQLLKFQPAGVRLLSGLALLASAAVRVDWSHLSPLTDDWYVLCHLMVPLTILWAFGNSLTQSYCSARAAAYALPTDPSQAQHLQLHDEKSILVSIPETRTSSRSLPVHLCATATRGSSPAISSCVANLAHEIRTPLNALLSCCTLLSDTPLSPDQLDFVNIMMTCGSQITNNINFVLDLAKMEQGKLVLEHKPLDLGEVSRECFRVVHHLAEQKHLKLELRYGREGEAAVPLDDLGRDARPVSILGDASRLKQVMLNLLTNAVKFTYEGGVSITIIEPTTTSSPYTVPLDLVLAPMLRIEITDTGIGMSEEQQKRLFQPFEQASSETYGKYGGTGLGLVISKQLVELMHGSIRIDATRTSVGKGSTFVIELPFCPSESPTFGPPDSPTNHSPHSPTSLAGEEEMMIARRRLLSPSRSRTRMGPVLPRPHIIRKVPSKIPPSMNASFEQGCGVHICVDRNESIGQLALDAPQPGSPVPPLNINHLARPRSNVSFMNASPRPPLPPPLPPVDVPTSARVFQLSARTAISRITKHSSWVFQGGAGSEIAGDGALAVNGMASSASNAFDLEQLARLSRQNTATATELAGDCASLSIPPTNTRTTTSTFDDRLSSFCVTPHAAAAASSIVSSARPSQSALSSRNTTLSSSLADCFQRVFVLTVDDNEISNRLMGKLLLSIGFPNVQAVSSGEAAMEFLQTTPNTIDVIITDIHLPGMSGFELSAQVRQLIANMPTATSIESNPTLGGGGGKTGRLGSNTGVPGPMSGSCSSTTLSTRPGLGIPHHLQKPGSPKSGSRSVATRGSIPSLSRWPVIIALSGVDGDESITHLCAEAGIDAFLSKPVTRTQLFDTIGAFLL